MVEMKKGFGLLIALLAVCMAMPALAQSTGVQVDGKTYVITGGDGTYEVDGKTFVIEGNTVVVQGEGKEDLRLTLEAAEETDVVEAGTAVYTLVEGTSDVHVQVTTPDSMEAVSEIAYTVVEDATSSNAVEFSNYAKYGLSYDANHDLLYYQGKLVRILEDEIVVDANSSSHLAFYNPEGAVDVRALRDSAGELTGLEALSEAEFAARDLTAWTDSSVTVTQITATAGEELPREEREAFFAPYAAHGLRYDAENDLLFYQDQQVRKFVDVRVSNGENPEGGKFQGVLTQLIYEGGAVDVTVVRDYEHPDAEGEGELLGLSVMEVK